MGRLLKFHRTNEIKAKIKGSIKYIGRYYQKCSYKLDGGFFPICPEILSHDILAMGLLEVIGSTKSTDSKGF